MEMLFMRKCMRFLDFLFFSLFNINIIIQILHYMRLIYNSCLFFYSFIFSKHFYLKLEPLLGTLGVPLEKKQHTNTHLGPIKRSQSTYLHVFGRCERKPREPRGSPHGQGENMWSSTQTNTNLSLWSNQRPWTTLRSFQFQTIRAKKNNGILFSVYWDFIWPFYWRNYLIA